MNDASLRTSREIAADFVAKLYLEGLTVTELERLDSWLAEGGSNPEEYRLALETWELVGQCSPKDELPVSRGVSVPTKPGSKGLLRGMSWAAAILMVIVFGGMLWPEQKVNVPSSVTYTTLTGERSTYDLPDGSKVQLNTNSRIRVTFDASRRRVDLLYGQAFFDVVADATSPFQVGLGSKRITVLGTKFDVYRRPFSVTVGVVDGEIALHSVSVATFSDGELHTARAGEILNEENLRIKAGLLVELNDGGGMQATSLGEGGTYPLWREGLVKFRNTELSEMVRELNRYSRKKILIEDSRIMSLRISAVFPVDDIHSIIESLEKMFGITVVEHPDRISLLKK
ncbi:FecR domain-containing protein [Porticoccaceae bacterium LTM1]|nr:FecR domain-containing protein [Porticoccaceae bacterium LTM1]